MKTSLRLLAVVAFGLTTTLHASSITWSGNGNSDNSGNWSASSNWDLTAVPGSLDSATLGDVTIGTRTVSYDITSNGSLSSLIMTQSTAGATNVFDIANNLTVASPIVIGATAGSSILKLAPSSTGVTLRVGAVGSTGLTINSGGTLILAFGTGNVSGTIENGDVLVAGGTIQIANPYAGSSGQANIKGLTMTSGTIFLDNSNGRDPRLSIGGNLNVTGGTIGRATTANTAGQIVLNGATNTMTGFAWGPGGALISLTSGNQSLLIDQPIYDLLLRGAGDMVKTVTNSGAAHTFQTIQLTQQTTGKTTTFRMGSDMTLANNSTANFVYFPGIGAPAAASTVTFSVDLNGHTLDVSSNANAWKPNTGSFTSVWNVNSSQAGGRMIASGYNFNTSSVSTVVGNDVVMEARGGNNSANDLSDTTGTPGTIAASSTFLYNGGAASATAATLTSNRTIGGLQVDKKPVSGTSSNLKLLSNITAAGHVAILDSGSRLDLNGKTLTLTGSAKLSGVGTYANSSATAATINFGAGSTGGLTPGGDNTIGNLSLSGASLMSIDLSNAAVSIFDINGTTAGLYDTVDLGLSSIVYGGQLQLNFGYTPILNDQFTLFANIGSETGNFSNITSNLSGYDFLFNAATGIVTVTAVPEPSAFAMVAVGGLLSLALKRRRW